MCGEKWTMGMETEEVGVYNLKYDNGKKLMIDWSLIRKAWETEGFILTLTCY